MKRGFLYTVYLGCAGWRHSDGFGALYPPDLPEDWQFAFYQTQFRCVWLDAVAWQSLDEATWVAMAADVTGDFRFVLEGRPDEIPPALHRMLGERLVVLAPDSPMRVSVGPETDLRALAARLQTATLAEPVFLVMEPSALARKDEVELLLEMLGL